ncbi:uncharacterized protein CC84DRAFT_1166085 [Paraphaeosphaeria sporulosa]|uniref:C3H1-type domain-containing protein n=1 Tax=Paraphaeosphaeria sporulosa TaxID=1460663 RepID=A0A177CAX8_9PLEO|nr:uncharacterized protein CC84DRAFT_1166085 [Paraphaeosphaeria sporulosa]OAG03938.1 hypothetical protein CC84DRAFT_1166085 [Paraphaeosphaeria sporulosa]
MSADQRWTKDELRRHIDQLHGHAQIQLTERSDQNTRIRALELDNQRLREALTQHGVTPPQPIIPDTFGFPTPVTTVNNTINNITFAVSDLGTSGNNAASSQTTNTAQVQPQYVEHSPNVTTPLAMSRQPPSVALPQWRTPCRREQLEGRCRERNNCGFAHDDQRATQGMTRINALPKHSSKTYKQK